MTIALTLDFDNRDQFESHHYAFHVNDQDFDAIFDRVKTEGIAYGSGPSDPENMQIYCCADKAWSSLPHAAAIAVRSAIRCCPLRSTGLALVLAGNRSVPLSCNSRRMHTRCRRDRNAPAPYRGRLQCAGRAAGTCDSVRLDRRSCIDFLALADQ